MVPPAAIALLAGDLGLAVQFSLVALLGGLVGALILLSIAGRPRALTRMDGLLAVVLVWLAATGSGTLSIAEMFDVPLASALFEATAALTTTGQSVLGERASLPVALLFWRVLLEWFGGLLTLACLLQVVAPAGLGRLPQFTARLFTKPRRQRAGEIGSQTLDTMTLSRSRRIAERYVLVTAGFWLAFLLSEGDILPSAMLAMVGIATGGFLFFDGAVIDRLSLPSMAILALSFLLGATSILWRSPHGGARPTFQANVEALAIVGIAATLALTLVLRLASVSGEGVIGLSAVIEGLLGATSLVATSGIESRPGFIALLPDVAVLIVILVGASLFSTTGGVKLYRVVGLARYAERELVNLIYPSAIMPLTVGGRPVTEDTLGAIWAYFVFAIAFVGVATFGLAMGPFNFEAAFKAAVALFTNAGLTYDALVPATGSVEEGWPAFRDVGPALLAWSAFVMLLGRLEILVVFAALNIRFWTGR